jgi:hypothetical protein
LSLDDLRDIPSDSAVVLIDQNAWGASLLPDRHVTPFMECGGEYWGPPATDDEAIAAIGRLRARGTKYVLVMWPAFWWLTYYRGFHDYLRATARCTRENDRLVLFELEGVPSGAPGGAIR